MLQLRPCRLIQIPHKISTDRLHTLTRQVGGRILKRGAHDVCLAASIHQKHHIRACVEHWVCTGNAPGAVLGNVVSNYEMLFLFQRLGAGKERGGVPLWSDSEKDEIDLGELPGCSTEKFAKPLFVQGGGLVRVGQFASHTENVVSRDWQFREQRLLRHAEIAFGKIRRHMAFVAPKEEHLIPRKLLSEGGCEFVMQAFRCRAARERDRVAAVLANGLLSDLAKLLSGCAEKFGVGIKNANLGIRGHEETMLPLRGTRIAPRPGARAYRW